MIREQNVEKRAVTNARLGTDVAKRDYVYEDFKQDPVCVKRLVGGAPTGTAADINLMQTRFNIFYYVMKGTQTIVAPVLTATGLNVSLDQTDDDGVEIHSGILARGPSAFTIGTSAAFSFSLKFKITDVSGTDDCLVGFRRAAASQANVDDYTDMAALNVILGDINIETILNNAATTTTDTTNNWADGETHTLKVKVSAAGAATYEIDGAAPLVTAAFTFDATDVVVPFFFFLQATTSPGIVELIEWKCGLDSEA